MRVKQLLRSVCYWGDRADTCEETGEWLEYSLREGWRENKFSSLNAVTQGSSNALEPYFRKQENDSHRYSPKEHGVLLCTLFFSLLCSFHKYLLRHCKSKSWDVLGYMSHSRQEHHPGAEGGEAHMEPSIVPSLSFMVFFTLFYGWGNWGSRTLYYMTKFTQQIYERGAWPQSNSVRLFVLG